MAMITTIKNATPVARKKQSCDASYFLLDVGIDRGIFTFSELRAIVLARKQGWQIQPGQRYISQFNTDGGYTWTYRAIPAIHDICIKYLLFPDV